jgi:hypothetical protein
MEHSGVGGDEDNTAEEEAHWFWCECEEDNTLPRSNLPLPQDEVCNLSPTTASPSAF